MLDTDTYFSCFVFIVSMTFHARKVTQDSMCMLLSSSFNQETSLDVAGFLMFMMTLSQPHYIRNLACSVCHRFASCQESLVARKLLRGEVTYSTCMYCVFACIHVYVCQQSISCEGAVHSMERKEGKQTSSSAHDEDTA